MVLTGGEILQMKRTQWIVLDRFFLSILAMQGRTEKDIELINYIKDRILKDRNFFIHFIWIQIQANVNVDYLKSLLAIE